MEFIQGFLGNDSAFGRLMYRLGVIVLGNVLFLICSLPIITVGASFSGLYYLCLKARRDRFRGNVRIIQSFFRGFRDGFKQATVGWLAMIALAAALFLEISWCEQFSGPVAYFKYGLIGLLVIDAVAFMYFFPVVAAFRGDMRSQVANTAFFAFSRPHYLIVVAALHVAPVVLTYANLKYLPLSAFLWAVCGFGLIAYISSFFHLRQYTPFLPALDPDGNPIGDGQEDEGGGAPDESEEKTLAEMMKYGL